MASATLAEAGGRAATESYPNLATLGEHPVPARVAPASPAIPVATAPVPSRREMRLARRGRRSRYARGRAEWAAREQRSPQIVAAAQPVPTAAPASPQPAVVPVATPLAPSQEPAAKTPGELRASLPPLAGPHETGSPTLTDLIAKHAQQNGVPVELARAVVRIESRGNPHASNGGALGLMQIKPGTARAAGFQRRGLRPVRCGHEPAFRHEDSRRRLSHQRRRRVPGTDALPVRPSGDPNEPGQSRLLFPGPRRDGRGVTDRE